MDATFEAARGMMTRRPVVEAMELMLAPEGVIEVLDKGFVRVVDYMGSDGAVVQAARVSYGEGTKTRSEDAGLIRYLMRNHHTSPFEMCEIKLHVKLPVFVARQWIRHRTANVNEYSARYSIVKEEFFMPDLERLGRQSKTNKQGTDAEGYSDDQALQLRDRIGETAEAAFDAYNWLIDDVGADNDLSRELARVVLPLSSYTEWYWKVDVHNLMHFLRLRADPHAQKEIRDYAEVICGIMMAWMPLSMQAFYDYKYNAVTFSAQEMEILKLMVLPDFGGFVDEGLTTALSSREFAEFKQKLGLVALQA